MRTAEEILESFSDTAINWPLNKKQNVIAAMKEYATEACREQVRLCLIEAGVNAPDFSKVYVAIGHAPLPELK